MGLKTEEANCQSQFEAAVRVIQGLPKNGSYRPSYEEMLRFYGYYKQATMGQCQIRRPGFWDPIGRYKWDAWKRLGKMTKEEAMAAYIMEMKKAAQKVINTVPMDEASEDMFVYFEPLYEVIHDMPRPPESFFKKKSDSETASLQNSSLDGVAEIYPNPSVHEDCKQAGPGLANKVMKSNQVINDSKNEVFCDSLEQVESHQARRLSAKQNFPLSNPPRSQATEKTGSSMDLLAPSHLIHQQTAPPEINQSPETIRESQISVLTQKDMTLQVMSTIQALQQDMKKAMERLNYLESWAALQHPTSMLKPCLPSNVPDAKELPSWPVHLSPHTWFFLLAWPFVVQWLLWYFQRQKR
ncbi:acyl-CoA-binding domain-containing protein 4 [Protobothrops mucrosquamatus]|uniref:acyl-CoA-binding domain-containing protein 4 n=1 Tax=Protobothrops mucrosquamatus TaxID=103944 RepID=UPI000775AA0E|nr:acyl-CoA-binding domain-containing protein 4 [Protobothrops mucrosquamatus]XP_015670117.1 acyl-CoA-binding domain-containing protein 4 [Protobothrops mucrosquamatus]XP_015670118.1 acyl-CoA-binding domain-containing protein 4 [Protobothrops mucrosquamatus]XP_015670119.1 acyl-CoA-binding domain-containing protein 4 [Protobothrops mucrosquamatus]